MSEWAILRSDQRSSLDLWHDVGSSGVRVITQSLGFNLICRDELGWEMRCLARESPPVLVPFVIRRRRGTVPTLAESLAYGQIGGALTDRPLSADDARDVALQLKRIAMEVLVYPGNEGFAPPGWEAVECYTHEVRLAGDSAGQWAPSRACRCAARHAARCGVDIVRITGEPLVTEAALLHRRQQLARGARAYPRRWLARLAGELPDQVGLWGAVLEGRLLAALLVGWWQRAATALVSTTDPQARPLKAGNLLYVHVLEWLEGSGIHTVDLGGSRDLPALEAFKRSLGGSRTLRPYYRYRHPGFALYQRIAGSTRLTATRRRP